MANITVLGSGFGALTTIRELRRNGVEDEITAISPRDELHYLPSSIWLPAGLRKGSELKIPLSNFFTEHRVRHIMASVTGLSADGRVVLTDAGEFRNDQLVIATGARFIRKLPGIEHALVPCEGIAVGEEIARRLEGMAGGTIAVGFATNPNEQGAVRGGPMFEFLFIIDSLLRRQGRRERFKLAFFNPSPRPGQRLGDKAVDGLLQEMTKRGIETRLGHKMVRLEADKVVTEGGEFCADLILFMPGLTGPAWLANADLPLSPGGMIAADEKCRVKDRDGVWVVGDSGSFPGPDWLPKQAHQADLQAKAAAENIAAELKGRAPQTDFKAELICIVDMLDTAMLVYRSETRSFLGPKMKLFHWLKRYFEGHYLRAYR
ncbi:MAG: NAD(P)/FAD-dependent oxidoreductase [Alphaproteobacteria bacterium]|nr:NAD(P)/FAD-dependent oxidoreductase [Rhizobiaceae bacterium]MBU3959925.1 NAD(P)/FAD-dependent oxidoreductase [Alphaproteobacteria bacterium]MBU4050763.1 NAD(P)/FAD-dependent oxidoreductase [Alphaproteobacteria bacterium]MBU4089580.1 NAD(P)/FAD-dependent oxidoreductase [Alphaproteobacteria bacterium]MBU4155484.1 NAD(P)/FAD-dependent oxidoreductase [Alphaproteobacteria bacterium]